MSTHEVLDTAELLRVIADVVDSAKGAVRAEVNQANLVVADAIANLTRSFEGLREQTRAQERLLFTLINRMGTGSEAASEGVGFSDFVDEINEILRYFVDQMLGVSTESMNMVHRVDDLTGNMDNVVGLLRQIDRIVSKTNFLALNAHIEAARAGEAGEAFKIVADEVRSLSRESSHFSKEIRHVVEQSKHDIEETRMKVGDIASQDMSQALKSRARVSNMLDGVQELNDHVSKTLETVQEMTHKVAESVGVAVRSLQFEDILTQVLGEGIEHLDLLDSLSERIREARQIAREAKPAEVNEIIRRLAAEVGALHELHQSRRTKVLQETLDEGSVELF